MEKYKWILAILFSFCVLISSLWFSVEFPARDINFYLQQYDKNETYSQINISEEDLHKVTTHIIDYLLLKTNQLNVDVQINSQIRPFYNEKELAHMVDVQNLFKIFIQLSNLCKILVIVILIILILLKDITRILAKALRAVFCIFLAITSTLCIIISTDFNKYFTIFHEIFFSNDLWQLDPSTDLLINIVPLPFFISIALYAALIFIAISIFIIIFTTVLLRYNRKHRSYLGAEV